MLSLNAILAPERNNFTLVRLLSALAVLISHTLLLHSGNPANEILAGLTFYNLGEHAVNVFFVLSGLMVSMSLARASSPIDFALARILRIFPALVVCTLVIALAIGPLVTQLPPSDYFSNLTVLKFVLRTMFATTGGAELPEVFTTNPYPAMVDAPIWTLKYEIFCYFALAILVFTRAIGSSFRFAAVIAASCLLSGVVLIADWRQIPDPVDHMCRFWLCFSFGMILHRLRHVVPVSVGLVMLLGGAWWATHGTPLERIVSLFVTGYGAIWVASIPLGPLRKLTSDIDLSYGIYIYGWPITQLLVWSWPNSSTASTEMAAVVTTVIASAISWFAIEKRALAIRKPVVSRIKDWLNRNRPPHTDRRQIPA